MGTCSICGRSNVDTISGVCGKCIGKNRARVRRKRNTTKIVIVIIICGVGVYGLQYLLSSGILQNTVQDVSNKASETVKELEKQGSSLSKSLEETTQQAQKSISKSTDTTEKEIQTALEIHRLVNIERQNQGLSALGYDEPLASVAKSHSQDMSNRNYFSHDTPDGLDPTGRANQAGYSCRYTVSNLIYTGVAENIFKIEGSSITFWDSPEGIAQTVVSGWMDSAGHRQNILTSHYRNEGIGVVITNFDVYATQNFC